MDEIEESQMYVLVTPQDVDVTFTGTPIHSDIDIPLRKGWNYINYPFEYEMNIEDALHDFNPQVGDKIQDEQKRESTFTILRKGGKWDGPVQILEPGKGYKYYSMEPKTVHYHQHADLKVVKSIAVDGHDMYVSMVGVDQEPVEGSRNLITSGAVYAALNPGQ